MSDCNDLNKVPSCHSLYICRVVMNQTNFLLVIHYTTDCFINVSDLNAKYFIMLVFYSSQRHFVRVDRADLTNTHITVTCTWNV